MRTYVRQFAVSDINIAFGQITYMSSEYGFDACRAGCPSKRAVDGDRSTSIDKCCLTRQEDNPWWAVKLLRDDNIAKVVITNRGGVFGRKESHLADFMSLYGHRDDCNTSIDSIRKAN